MLAEHPLEYSDPERGAAPRERRELPPEPSESWRVVETEALSADPQTRFEGPFVVVVAPINGL